MKKILDFFDFSGRRMRKRALLVVGQHWAEWVKFVGGNDGYIPSHKMYVADELEAIMRKIEDL